MRARSIKPGFFKNEDLAMTHPLGRILFSGLWCMADRSGRLEDRPKRIKAEVLPYDVCNIEKLLSDLHQKRFITRYAVNGQNYIQINNFLKHQNPHCREPESQLPQQDEHSANTVLGTTLNVPSPADSPFPISDSPFPLPVHDGFCAFWNSYPKKVQKQKALQAWKKLCPTEELQQTILSDVNAKANSEQWTKEARQFCPHPASYLNGRRWEDEVPAPPQRDPMGFLKYAKPDPEEEDEPGYNPEFRAPRKGDKP